MCFILPDRIDSGKTTHDPSLCYLLVRSASIRRGSLSGTLRLNWLFGEKIVGLRGARNPAVQVHAYAGIV